MSRDNAKPAPRIVGVDWSKRPDRYCYTYRGLDGKLKTLRLDEQPRKPRGKR